MSARVKLALAALLVGIAGLLWLARPAPPIAREEADAIAARVLARFVADSGDFEGHFAPPRAVGYPDGWDYSWTYRLCPDVGELRVFVSTRGRASITATPECDPLRAEERPRIV